EADDLANEIALQLMGGKRPYVLTLREFDKSARTKTLQRIGTRLASQERDDYDYFHGNFRYSLEEVRQLLRGGALFHVGQEIVESHFSKREEAGGATDPNPLGFKEPKIRDQTENLDVEVCFRSRSENHQRVLVAADNTVSDERHHRSITEAEEVRMHTMNLIDRSARAYHDGLGSRKTISNAQAAVINNRQTEDYPCGLSSAIRTSSISRTSLSVR